MDSAESRDSSQADLTPGEDPQRRLAHFARDGFQKANLRAIAASAGVSEALIFHHFGSKNGLRATCDDYVLNFLIERARAAGSQSGLVDLLGVYLSDPEEYQLRVRYMARTIQQDTPAANTSSTRWWRNPKRSSGQAPLDGTMRPSSDPRALAVLNLVLTLGLLTMSPPLARTLGHEHFGPDVLRRMTIPAVELYTHGLYTDHTLPKASQDAWATARPPHAKED